MMETSRQVSASLQRARDGVSRARQASRKSLRSCALNGQGYSVIRIRNHRSPITDHRSPITY